jgi:hypothetical protein
MTGAIRVTAWARPQGSPTVRRYTRAMGGSVSQNSHASPGEDDAVLPLESPDDTPASQSTPNAWSYLALAVALLTAAGLLALATIGVPGTFLHIEGIPAMATSALAMLLAAGALLALRSALGARRNRI